MRKIITIAVREYLAMVATKAFIISMAVMPIFMFGSLAFSALSENMSKEKDKNIAIFDPSGEVFSELAEAAKKHNSNLTDDGTEPRIDLTRLDFKEFNDAKRLELSNEVRESKLSAFVELPGDLLEDSPSPVRYYSTAAPFESSKRWLHRELNSLIQSRRLQNSGINPETVRRASVDVPVKGMQLYTKTDGEIKSGVEKQAMTAVMVPFGMMMLMFMIVMLTAQPMLESVLEEKTERIAEVLLGAANPFQIMVGKLLGNVSGSLTVFVVYVLGSLLLVKNQDWEEHVPFDVLPWFAAFQVLAVLFFSSIFMSIGASVRQLKEAQGMLMPVWLTMATPMFIWMPTLRDPNGTLATAMSFFPPATPMMMVLRLSTDTPIPLWQCVLALLLMVASTTCMVFVASRIFRVAILWQGKTPKLTELMRWAISSN
jgi:ABC-2 type transport system permease protein